MSSALLKSDRVLVALGGNAVERDDQICSKEAIGEAVQALAELYHDCLLAIVHGNGPQFGHLKAEYKRMFMERSPARIVWDTQDMIGREILKALGKHMGDRESLIHYTRSLIDLNDPSFNRPVKGVGPWVRGRAMFDRAGVSCVEHPKRRGFFKQVVPSPKLQAIVGIDEIHEPYEQNDVVICGGGGGIPSYYGGGGQIYDVESECVSDKDEAGEKIGEGIGAQVLLIATREDGFYEGFGTDQARLVDSMSSREAFQRAQENRGGDGNMNPKIIAAGRFALSQAGRVSVITSIPQLSQIAQGNSFRGTIISNNNLAAV